MVRWLLLIAGVYLLYRWIKGKNSTQLNREDALKSMSDKAPEILEPEVMVPCQYCNVHLPQSTAITFEQRFYCCEEHLHELDIAGWIGSANWRPSPNYDVRPENIQPDLVVIHHISLPPSEFNNKYSSHYIVDFFQNKLDPNVHPYFAKIAGQKVSSHFLITRSGELIQFVSTLNKAWHAGVSSFLGREKCNDFSIGIEFEGDGESAFEDAQYKTLTALVKRLSASYPNLQFAGHSDIAPDRKTDPGPFFDWQKLQKETEISPKNLPYGVTFR